MGDGGAAGELSQKCSERLKVGPSIVRSVAPRKNFPAGRDRQKGDHGSLSLQAEQRRYDAH
jgi:hypothetical protein